LLLLLPFVLGLKLPRQFLIGIDVTARGDVAGIPAGVVVRRRRRAGSASRAAATRRRQTRQLRDQLVRRSVSVGEEGLDGVFHVSAEVT